MTSMTKLLNALCVPVAATLFASTLPAAAQQAKPPCPAESMIDIGAGICADPQAATKREQAKDTDGADVEKAEPAAEVAAAAANNGRDDKTDLKARAKQRQDRIDILTREAGAPLDGK